MYRGKLKVKNKLSYGIASMGDSMLYCLINMYGLYFLTTVVNMEPVLAGLILAIGSVWNALWNPIIGYISDRLRTKYGKRRVLMYISAPTNIIFFTLMFTKVPFSGTLQMIYYLIMIIGLWTVYSCFFVPFSTLGGEYTTDYNDKQMLRIYAAAFNYVGMVAGLAFPVLAADMLQKFGFSLHASWTILAAIISIVAAFTIFSTAYQSKRFDPPCQKGSKRYTEPDKGSIKGIFKEYYEIFKIKPIKWVIVMSVAGLMSYTLSMSNLAYYLKYYMGLTSNQIAATTILRSVFGIPLLILGGKLVFKYDKAKTLLILNSLSITTLIIVRVFCQPSLFTIFLYMFGYTLATGSYWLVAFSIYYDLSEYDRLVNKKERRGAIVSFQGFSEAVSSGLASQLLGVILQIAGFNVDLEVQSETTLSWICNSSTYIPSVFMIISVIAIYKYPMNRARYNNMIESNGQSEIDLIYEKNNIVNES